jgi:hypothetical protein
LYLAFAKDGTHVLTLSYQIIRDLLHSVSPLQDTRPIAPQKGYLPGTTREIKRAMRLGGGKMGDTGLTSSLDVDCDIREQGVRGAGRLAGEDAVSFGGHETARRWYHRLISGTSHSRPRFRQPCKRCTTLSDKENSTMRSSSVARTTSHGELRVCKVACTGVYVVWP